jgi:ABC-type transport system substrate-binding protein
MFNTEGWDVGSGGIFPSADPSLIQPILPTWAGWYESTEMQAFLKLMSRHADPKVRQQLWERAQRFFYEDVPAVKFGDYFWFHPHRREVRGFTGPFLLFHWNTWLETR